MTHVYSINGRYVTPEEFAAAISDLLHAGWTLTPPPPPAPQEEPS